jgi:hypothetical protein
MHRGILIRTSICVLVAACLALVGGALSVGECQSRLAEVARAQADQYGAVADKAVDALVRGDAKSFKDMLSPGTIKREQRGADAVDVIIKERFMPFFQDFSKMSPTSHAFPTFRGIDSVKGVGFARSFTARDGTDRFFVIFVLEEAGKLTIGNLLLNKTFADVRRGV